MVRASVLIITLLVLFCASSSISFKKIVPLALIILPPASLVTQITEFPIVICSAGWLASSSTVAETAVFFSIFTFCVMVLSVTAEYVMPFIISSLTLQFVFAESVKVSSLPLSTFPSAGRGGLTSILPLFYKLSSVKNRKNRIIYAS